ncbi:MAG: energy-coupling factor transporter transmembrane component T [Bacillota bacterium]|nr:energy-coupling factor transporter transmembrane component T [Bacillota bacterium]
MKSISLYTDRKSVLHSLDPINKLYYIAFAIFIPIILPSIEISLACVALSFTLLISGKVFTKTMPAFGVVLFTLLTVILIQGLFRPGNATILFQAGPFTMYREGLLYASILSLRVINIVSSFMILVLTTSPSDLVDSLVRKGMSPRIGYVISSVFQIIPEMMAAMETITDAQRARGMETEGNLRVRIRAFFPLLGPVVLGSLINTKERAMALEVRGFNAKSPKTYLLDQKQYRFSTVIQWGILFVIGCAIVWRLAS